EFGDVLFTLANLARKLDLDAELCLMQSNRKFATRFKGMETLAQDRDTTLAKMTLDEMELLYQGVKENISATTHTTNQPTRTNNHGK
ncbi:MAG: hypothetical protein Q9M16_05665, partial [Mariprofundus sp.]|nr:hypothetical protein [Mariprofundus sp.]